MITTTACDGERLRRAMAWTMSMGRGARRRVRGCLAKMPAYYREGAIVETAQHLKRRATSEGYAVRLGAELGTRPTCPAEKSPAGTVKHDNSIFALQVATCANLGSYRGEVPTQPNSVTE